MNVTNAAIFSKLSSATALTGLLPGTASIYHMQAPAGAVLPFVVYNLQAGGRDELPGTMPNHYYHIRAYADSARLAGSVDAQIEAAIGGTITVSGYNAFYCKKVEDTELIDNPPDDQPVYMAGGIYRFRLSKA